MTRSGRHFDMQGRLPVAGPEVFGVSEPLRSILNRRYHITINNEFR